MFLQHTKWAFIWALIILILCGIPGTSIPHSSFLEILEFDKFVHAGMFFVLMTLTLNGFIKQTSVNFIKNNALICALAICVLYGALTEVLQGAIFVERSPSLLDFIANTFGCIMAIIVFKKISLPLLNKIHL